jgi:hypothetical protein
MVEARAMTIALFFTLGVAVGAIANALWGRALELLDLYREEE